jgi:hypothetical protein
MLVVEMAVGYEHEPQSRGPLTRTEYEGLVRRGVLEEAHVELLYGRVVTMGR